MLQALRQRYQLIETRADAVLDRDLAEHAAWVRALPPQDPIHRVAGHRAAGRGLPGPVGHHRPDPLGRARTVRRPTRSRPITAAPPPPLTALRQRQASHPTAAALPAQQVTRRAGSVTRPRSTASLR